MKGSLKIWMVILGIVAAGSGITCLTNSYVNRQIKKMEETMPYKQEAVLAESGHGRLGQGQEMAEKAGEGLEEEPIAPIEPGPPEPQKDFSAKTTMPQENTQKKVADNPEEAEEKAADNLEEVQEEAADNLEEAQEDAMLMVEAAPAAPNPEENVQETEEKPETAALSGAEEKTTVEEKTAVLEVTEYPPDLQEALSEYRERFPQIDLQIAQMRKSETENNVYSVKNTAQTELRIWEREMEGLYRLLCDSLDVMACEQLKKEQQEWLQLRDGRAEEAAKKNSGGSLETVDYLASIAASNRERAYELLEKYQE